MMICYSLFMLARFVCITVSVLLAAPAAAAEFQDDLKARRARVLERLGPDAMLILWSAPVRTYSNDVEYEFRQDSYLYYLTGIDQPDTILVLMPGNSQHKEILFVLPANPVREHWEGHILTPREATEMSGIGTIERTGDFEAFLAAVMSRRPFGAVTAQEARAFFGALESNRAKVALLLGPAPRVGAEITEPYRFVNRLKERHDGFTALDATPVIDSLRQVKTAYELKVMEESARISSDAHMAGMRAARPGAYEYEVEAAIEFTYKRNGAFDWSYPSIVGSGPNANTLHYNASSRQMQDGDLLLVDAAANYRYITVDITRTYPINGRFSPLQRDIYTLVYRAHEESRAFARPGVVLADVHQKSVDVIKQGLLALGLITDASGDQYRIWYTHGSNHWIGMDVHDVGDYRRPLEPGMTFVIEPGLYIRESALDNLPRTAENAAFIEKVRPAVQKYKDIGARLEDSYVVTATGLRNLSARVPRTVEEIEAFMRTSAPASR
jgi:Xaa-Pro aminopeptidase